MVAGEGLEPMTTRLTVEGSTAELQCIMKTSSLAHLPRLTIEFLLSARAGEVDEVYCSNYLDPMANVIIANHS